MTISAIGANHFLPAIYGGNPLQAIGLLAITTLAIKALAKLPMALAREARYDAYYTNSNGNNAEIHGICDVLCEPLPGGADDPPERICVKTCKNGAEIIKTRTKEMMKDGKWKSVEVLGKVATPVLGYFDCSAICSPEDAAKRAGGSMLWAAGNWIFGRKDKIIKDLAGSGYGAICSSLLAGNLIKSGAGTAACWACCAPMKYFGKV